MAQKATYRPLMVLDPEINPRLLCDLVRDAGEDLQASAMIEYPEKGRGVMGKWTRSDWVFFWIMAVSAVVWGAVGLIKLNALY